MTDVTNTERWVIERGPITDPEYFYTPNMEGEDLVVGAQFYWTPDPEAATRFSTPELATEAAAETRVDALRVVSDVDL